jgi:hypothetical protein
MGMILFLFLIGIFTSNTILWSILFSLGDVLILVVISPSLFRLKRNDRKIKMYESLLSKIDNMSMDEVLDIEFEIDRI